MGHSFERVYLLQLLSMRAHCSVRRAIFAILKLAFVDVWAGSTIAFCEACAILKHSKFNILHRVEILRDCNMYFPLSMERTLMLERHQCLNTTSSNVHFREIVVVDSRGIFRIPNRSKGTVL